MSGGYEHSIKVPRLYKTVAKIAQTVREDSASLKQLVYLKKHPNIKGVYALALTTLQNGLQLDQIIRSTKILIKEPRLDPWLTRVLITELLWGKKRLQSDCKPIQTILSYENQLRDELKNTTGLNLPDKSKVQKPRYVRINTLSNSVEEAISSFREEGWRPLYRSKDYASFIEALANLDGMAFIQDIHVPELLAFPPGTQFYNHAGYISGAIALQDKASCLPPFLLNATPGSVIMDMCAAPGMKTTHLAAMIQNQGKIYAVERDKRRYETLCQIVEITNSTCVKTVNADVMTMDAQQCPGVEYILVDPSCSGSGMLDRIELESNNDKCAPGRLKNLQAFQVAILRHALLNFPTVKRVVYSTCSVYPEENEQVVDEILSEVGDAYKLVPARQMLNDNWFNYSSTDYNCKDNCLYARPEVDLSNGFFVAVFERDASVPLPESNRKRRKNEANVVKNKSNESNENSESTDLVSKSPNKKKKKRNRSENFIDDISEAQECDENNFADNGNAENGHSEQEKREDSGRDEDVFVGNRTEGVPSVKRKKKKYKVDEPVDSMQSGEIQDECVDGVPKKKKCKKAHTENKNGLVECDEIQNGSDETAIKRKKKKQKHKRDESAELTQNECMDVVPKKKKCKKAHVEHEKVCLEEIPEGEATIVKLKKKKHKKSKQTSKESESQNE